MHSTIPKGPDGAPFAGAAMSPTALYSNTALCFDGKGAFSLVQVDATGAATFLREPSSGGSVGNKLVTMETHL